MDWTKIISLAAPVLGKTFSGGAAGMEQSRNAANTNAVSADRIRQQAMADYERALEERAALDIKQRDQDLSTRDQGYKQALRAEYLQNYTPAQRPRGVQMIHGGFNTVPQASRDLAKQFEQQATVRALNGQQYDSMPAIQQFTPTEMKGPSLWEKLSGMAGLGLQGAGIIANLKQKGLLGGADGDASDPFGGGVGDD